MGLAPLWPFWKGPSQPPVLRWSPQWQGQATCPGGSGASPLLLACFRLSLRALPFLWCDGVGYLPTHLPLQVLMRHGRSPGALLGLTVTFLPELPARPTLLRWRFLRTLLTLSALLPTHVLSRHKDQRSDGFSLSPAALEGGSGKVLRSAIPPQQPQALHWTQRPPPPSLPPSPLSP